MLLVPKDFLHGLNQVNWMLVLWLMASSKLSLKPHNRKVFWPQSSSTVCHVIHQALMMVIRNQFGTTVESCQSIMFNVVIHMKREKERLAMIYDTRMAYNVIINNRFVKIPAFYKCATWNLLP